MTTDVDENWKVLDETVVLNRAPWLEVSVQTVELPDGRIIENFHQIQTGRYAIVVAMDEKDRFLIFRQYKHGPGCITHCWPGGGVDNGESPLDAGRRELMEETGYRADTWIDLGTFHTLGNFGGPIAHVFLATGVTWVGAPTAPDMEGGELLFLENHEIENLLDDGQLHILGVVTGFTLAQRYLKQKRDGTASVSRGKGR